MQTWIAAILIKSGRKYLKRENRYFEKPINISIPVKNQDIAYEITWDRNLCFNFPDVFEKTNKLLSQSDYSYEFNYELIKKEVDQIENEMNKPSGFFVF